MLRFLATAVLLIAVGSPVFAPAPTGTKDESFRPMTGEVPMPRLKVVLLLGIVTFLVGFSAPAFAQEPPIQHAEEAAPEPANVAGEWVLTVDVQEAVLTLEQEGTFLTGTLNGEQGVMEVEGEVEGNELVFWGYLGEFALTFYGKVGEENKTIAGTLEAGDGAFVVDFLAVRIERR